MSILMDALKQQSSSQPLVQNSASFWRNLALLLALLVALFALFGAALLAHNLGKGRVIAMTDNPVFRGYFYGSSRLLVNALYLGASFSTAAD